MFTIFIRKKITNNSKRDKKISHSFFSVINLSLFVYTYCLRCSVIHLSMDLNIVLVIYTTVLLIVEKKYIYRYSKLGIEKK